MPPSRTSKSEPETKSPAESTDSSRFGTSELQLVVLAAETDYVHLECAGEIGFATLTPGSDPLVDLLGPQVHSKRVLVDLTKAQFLDTHGVGWLIGSHKRFLEQGGMLILHSIPPLMNKVIKLLRLERLLHIRPDFATARALAMQATT